MDRLGRLEGNEMKQALTYLYPLVNTQRVYKLDFGVCVQKMRFK